MLLNLVKLFSTFLTAVFGVLGTFKDFSKDSQSRKWQKITIAGVLSSAAISMVTQSAEYYNEKITKLNEEEARARQVSEEQNTSANLRALGSDLTEANKKLNDELHNEKAFAKDQKLVLRSQSAAATEQKENVSSLTRIINPVLPLAMTVDINVREAPSTEINHKKSCLAEYLDGLQTLVADTLNHPGGAPRDAHILRTSTSKSMNGIPDEVEISEKSSLAPSPGSRARPLMTLSATVTFRKPGAQPFTYDIEPASGLNAADEEMAQGTRLVPKGYDNFKIRFGASHSNNPGSIEIQRTYMNVRPNENDPSFLSMHDLVGSEMTLSVAFLSANSACNIYPDLNVLNLAWGQNYAFETSFQSDEFTREQDLDRPNVTVYTYRPKPSDFGFAH